MMRTVESIFASQFHLGDNVRENSSFPRSQVPCIVRSNKRPGRHAIRFRNATSSDSHVAISSVETKFAVDCTNLRWPNELCMSDPHRMEPAVDRAAPECEE